MEPNINSPLGTRSPYTPRSSSRSSRSSYMMPSSLKKSSRFSVSGRSVQMAQVVLKSQSYIVEKFGNTLPVIITEALTFSDRNSTVSVRISECGYAWLVCGRRLLVWQFRQNVQSIGASGTPQRKTASGSTQCYELTLPPSDLAHRADLVSVFINPGSNTPACIAVSPEGVVRYWPNVSHEGVSVEITAELQGQECDSVCNVGRLGCVLATTTCTVVLIQPRLSTGGRHSLSCHTLKTPQGWLGTIGKKMSSLIFGPIHSEHSTETRLVRVLSVKQQDDNWWVFVLAGHMLQKWKMNVNETEQLLYVTELGRVIRDAFQCTAWESCGSDPSEVDLWLLDIQVSGGSIMILAAAVNLHVSPQVQYALVRLDAEAIQTNAQVEEFLLLKLYGLYQEDNTAEFLSYRLLLCDNDIFIYRKRDITIVQAANDPEVLDFGGVGDKLLGGSVCGFTPVFFSQNYGLVAVYNNESTDRSFVDMGDVTMTLNDSKMQTMSTIGNLTLYSLEPEDMMTAHKDTLSQVKAAFLFHVRKQTNSCEEILYELFPEEGEVKNEVDNVLDKMVITISQELLNDAPAGDPRWMSENKSLVGLGSSTSMQIMHQLQSKQSAHDLFLEFLQQTGLWNRLSAVSQHNATVSTLHVLADHSELIVATTAIYNLMNMHNQLLLEVIDELFDEENKRGLTKQDLFFKNVSKSYKVIWALTQKCEKQTKSDMNPIDLINLITETNNIIINTIGTVMEFRQQKASFFTPNMNVLNLRIKYIPWTFAPAKHSIYDALNKQQMITLSHGARVTCEGASRACLYDQYVSLVDLLLDARKCNIESIRNTSEFDTLFRLYQAERSKLIQPLIDDQEWERAAQLAEKYLDYNILIVICERTNNETRLDEYLERFKSDDFAQYVFNWYMQENKQAKLLQRCKHSSKSKNDLTKYLATHPSLSWLQHIHERSYDKAAFTLRYLATEEKNLLTKKKSMLSIAKLSNLVANRVNNENDFIQNINRDLELIMFQEELPDSILSSFGYDTIKQPVLEPEKLAQLYICDENIDITENDFMKALEISNYVLHEDQRNELVLNIWCNAILRDSWKYKEPLSPIEYLQGKLFYKFVDLAITIGGHPQEVLPELHVLLQAPMLGDLKEDTQFQYLIKLAYDHFYRSQEMDEVEI